MKKSQFDQLRHYHHGEYNNKTCCLNEIRFISNLFTVRNILKLYKVWFNPDQETGSGNRGGGAVSKVESAQIVLVLKWCGILRGGYEFGNSVV